MTRTELLETAKPIIFNTEMVRAILDGRKTVTRRVVEELIPDDAEFGYTFFTPENNISCRGSINAKGKIRAYETAIKLPYIKNEILYVRETWGRQTRHGGIFTVYRADDLNAKNFDVKASGSYETGNVKWKPSTQMPKAVARIFLKVKDVRVERLQDITEEQAISEGIREYTKDNVLIKYAVDFDHYTWSNMPRTAIEAFENHWDSLVGKKDEEKCWAANPWVWVIEFEVMEVD